MKKKRQKDKKEPEKIFGEGVKQFSLRPGLRLSIVDILPAQPVRLDFELDEAPLEFSYHLSGHPTYSIVHDQGENSFKGRPGLNVVSAFPHSSGYMQTGEVDRNCMVAIHLDPLFFSQYVKKHLTASSDAPPPLIERLINEKSYSYLCQQAQLNPSMTIVANQLLACPYTGMLQKIFLESKTLELIVLQLGMISSSPQRLYSLTPGDIERVHKAKKFLIRDISSPPSLFQLARRVSLSHTKLNQGFRHEFGVTVFEYLRQHRLKQAKELLDSLEMNITEVAYATGFSSPSHFAKAFRNYYQVAPSSYLKEVRQRKMVSLPPF